MDNYLPIIYMVAGDVRQRLLIVKLAANELQIF